MECRCARQRRNLTEKGGRTVDDDIVELLAQRDQRGIELMIERYEKLIRYIAATILPDRDTYVEECVNDVYMKLWTHGAQYDEEQASFKTYLKAITRNTALNYRKKLGRLEEVEHTDDADTLLEEYIDYSQNPEQAVIVREEIVVLNQIIRSLKKKDREIILRRFYYLQSTSQIAEAMELSETAVDSRISRLRKKMKKSYEKEMMK